MSEQVKPQQKTSPSRHSGRRVASLVRRAATHPRLLREWTEIAAPVIKSESAQILLDIAVGATRGRVHALGDSHTWALQYIDQNRLMPECRLTTTSIAGATAQGVTNPNSTTQTLPIFRKALGSLGADVQILLHLGEVDCGFVIWHRMEKYGHEKETELERAVANYTTFIEEVAAGRPERVAVLGAVLPTIRDGPKRGEVARLRGTIDASQADRTELTLRFNESIRSVCEDRGLPYDDLTADLLDPETGLVSERFRNSDHLDHHLEESAAAPLWIAAIRRVLSQRAWNPKARSHESSSRISSRLDILENHLRHGKAHRKRAEWLRENSAPYEGAQ